MVRVLLACTGGAYPELPLLQYPLDMGRPEEQRGKQTLAVAVDIQGNANYDAIVRQGARANKVIHTGHQALIPKVDLLDPQVWEGGDQTDRVNNSVGAAVESVSVLQAQWAEKAAGAASACHMLLAEGGDIGAGQLVLAAHAPASSRSGSTLVACCRSCSDSTAPAGW